MKARVLLVDDEAYVRDSLAAVLERREFRVRTAAGAAEALQGGGLAEADALVTDLKMPGRDGLELLREAAGRHPALPVVVLTGHGTVPSAVECMQAGARDYLLKPADPEELVRVLRRALAPSRPTAAGEAARRDLTLRGSLADAERRLLEEALARADGVRREAARLLGVDERNLAYYLRKHGLMERGRKGS